MGGEKWMREIGVRYNKSQKAEFIFLKEFFKLCGIYVIDSKEKTLEELSDSLDGYRPEYFIDFIDKEKFLITGNDFNVKYISENWMKSVIDEIGKEQEEIRNELSYLVSIYVRNNLFYANSSERFFYCPNKERIEECIGYFSKALDSIKKRKSKPYHTQYFYLSCQSKINTLLSKKRAKRIYDKHDLINAAVELAQQDRGNYQGYILAGLIADSDLNYELYSEQYYKKVLGKSKPADAYVYYRLSRFFEKIADVPEEALRLQEKSYEITPTNYRSAYKIAFLKYKLGHIGAAMRMYQNVCEIIQADCGMDENALYEPIQLEYLLKSYKVMADIYSIWLDERINAGLMIDNISKLEKTIKKNIYFEKFFRKTRAAEERNTLIEHLKIKEYESYRNEI